eukprot:Seg1641.10 transcript_id=Seg1641.10/GoldUCD/mRNA.D3Y31 product="Zinc finger protein 474" protein_id=Seg1641.10/GoldUCD/D3Y31
MADMESSSTLIESKCFICSNVFDVKTLAEHEKDCLTQLQDNLTNITNEVDNLLEVDTESVKSATSSGSNDNSRKTVRCYICGSEFAPHFITVHEKQCKRNWESGITNDNLKKGASVGHIPAIRDIERGGHKDATKVSNIRKAQSVANMSHHEPKQAWNARMRESKENITKDNPKKRPSSARKRNRPKSAFVKSSSTQNVNSGMFSPIEYGIYNDTGDSDSISSVMHDKSVSLQDLSSNVVTKEKERVTTPKFIECQYCFKMFSIHSIHIHEKKCLCRTDNTKSEKPRSVRSAKKDIRCVSVNALHSIRDSDDWSMVKNLDSSLAISVDALNKPATSIETPRFLSCTFCGKPFGSKSLPIHLPQCQKKFERQSNDAKKTENTRLPRRNGHTNPGSSHARPNRERPKSALGTTSSKANRTSQSNPRSSSTQGTASAGTAPESSGDKAPPTSLSAKRASQGSLTPHTQPAPSSGIARESSNERSLLSTIRKSSTESTESSISSSSTNAAKNPPVRPSSAYTPNGYRAPVRAPKSSSPSCAYVACSVCSNYYGSASVKIHEAKCKEKMEKKKEELKLAKPAKRPLGRLFGVKR